MNSLAIENPLKYRTQTQASIVHSYASGILLLYAACRAFMALPIALAVHSRTYIFRAGCSIMFQNVPESSKYEPGHNHEKSTS